MGGLIEEMDGLQVRESPYSVSVVLTVPDFEEAVPRNADWCAVALGCKRQLASPFAHIMRSVAYVALPHREGRAVPGSPGKWIHFRFILAPETQSAVIQVDKGELNPNGTVVQLLAPTEQQTRAHRAEVRQRYREKGVRSSRPPKEGRPKKDVLTLQGVRNYSHKIPH